ncbi:MAG: TonB family protein [Acidobacteria bacterium]|nr:TonB family protein [Acidobacteriota bacterium]
MIAAICFSLLLAFAPATNSFAVQDKDYGDAREAYSKGDYQKAIELYTRLAEKHPKDFSPRFRLGLSYRKAKQYENAIAAFEQASQVQADPPFAQYEIGKTYLEMKNLEAVVRQYHLLEGKNRELALYLLDLFPQEAIEKYQLPAGERLPIEVKEAKPSKPLRVAANLRPTISYRERAKYTEIGRLNQTQGTVVLSVVFTSEGEITDITVVRSLPDGLTRSAIEAVKKIRFQPALKDGEPASVRGNIEFNFTLY